MHKEVGPHNQTHTVYNTPVEFDWRIVLVDDKLEGATGRQGHTLLEEVVDREHLSERCMMYV